MRMTIRFTMDDNSNAIIRQLDDKLSDALTDVGQFVKAEAQLRTPIDTGRLVGSIDSKKIGNTEVQIGTNVEYAIYVEKGTRKMKSQPFLTPAVESNIREIRLIFETHLRTIG